MGKLLSLLSRDESSCCAAQKYDIFLDFENADVSVGEEAVYYEVEKILARSNSILEEIALYKGAGKEIREAISNPTDEFQRRARDMVCPLVIKLKKFYDFSIQLEHAVLKLLEELCGGVMSPMQHLETQQALVKQFAQIIDFVLKFDEFKMKTPAIQNDFSYYRRSMRSAISQEDSLQPGVSVELANRMSLFFAHATPMLKVLTDATATFLKQNDDIPIENTTETFATMAKVCLRMLDTPNQFALSETKDLVLRVMVGLVILYDHVHPSGAFIKPTCLDVKACVKLLKEQPPSSSESLLNTLRYTTKHLNEDATPKHIKNLLAV